MQLRIDVTLTWNYCCMFVSFRGQRFSFLKLIGHRCRNELFTIFLFMYAKRNSYYYFYSTYNNLFSRYLFLNFKINQACVSNFLSILRGSSRVQILGWHKECFLAGSGCSCFLGTLWRVWYHVKSSSLTITPLFYIFLNWHATKSVELAQVFVFVF